MVSPALIRDAALGLLFTIVLVMVAFMVGPAIETRFFPVYSKFELIEASEKDGGTIARFRYTKLRECPAQGFSWYIGELGAASRQVPVKPITRLNQPRTVGVHETTPYLIEAELRQVQGGMRAEIFNRCHPFWVSRTEIYPPD